MVTKGPRALFVPSAFPLGTEEAGQHYPPCPRLESVWWVHSVRGTEQNLLASTPHVPWLVTRAPERLQVSLPQSAVLKMPSFEFPWANFRARPLWCKVPAPLEPQWLCGLVPAQELVLGTI